MNASWCFRHHWGFGDLPEDLHFCSSIPQGTDASTDRKEQVLTWCGLLTDPLLHLSSPKSLCEWNCFNTKIMAKEEVPNIIQLTFLLSVSAFHLGRGKEGRLGLGWDFFFWGGGWGGFKEISSMVNKESSLQLSEPNMESQNHLGCKRPLRLIPTVNLTLPSLPLNHVPKHHIKSLFHQKSTVVPRT